MSETIRSFTPQGADLISCDQPCDQEFTMPQEGTKSIKEFKSVPTLRCVASGAFLRGQHFGPSQEEHIAKPAACRVCTIYTAKIDNQAIQA